MKQEERLILFSIVMKTELQATADVTI